MGAFCRNPAYDYFPCQFQLFYRGKGGMWYDPVFKVGVWEAWVADSLCQYQSYCQFQLFY